MADLGVGQFGVLSHLFQTLCWGLKFNTWNTGKYEENAEDMALKNDSGTASVIEFRQFLNGKRQPLSVVSIHPQLEDSSRCQRMHWTSTGTLLQPIQKKTKTGIYHCIILAYD